jgi:hypothetical protein
MIKEIKRYLLNKRNREEGTVFWGDFEEVEESLSSIITFPFVEEFNRDTERNGNQ